MNRPTWTYDKEGWPGFDYATLWMLESIRDNMEQLNRSQMLQCDVAHAIKDLAKTLRRIDRRIAKLEGAKLIK